ncbi:hypothetical protein E8L99_00650 [Phreatobacter aquaticus]|uniref:Flagellar hook-length control protein-like C-terminal domain-containing protein n=1 Tax=Phreatobacter aquaticus TaxID=2570229 RepID=A0A4D7QCZ5_9HYPH|nr:flagellar hook-length control protein FliK [Phreatobacter aquaticus]QCK84405.1 hypothetical protein E8L99_00650 [Phreatobacter aquaticus]
MSVEPVKPAAAITPADNNQIRTLLQALGLKAGDTVSAKVTAMLANDVARLTIGDSTLDVSTPEPLTVGAALTMKVEQKGQALLLMTELPQATAVPAGSQPPPAAASGPHLASPAQAMATIVAAFVDLVGREGAKATGAGIVDGGQVAVAARGSTDLARAGEANANGVAGPKPAATPREALMEAVRSAAVRQDGLGPLFADATAILGRQAAGTMAPLPQPVAQALASLLGFQMPAEGAASPAALQRAVAQSGIFLEATLANAQGAPPPPDLKATLASLRQALGSWMNDLGMPMEDAPERGLDHARPPLRGALPQGQQPAGPSIPAGSTLAEIAQRLGDKTEAALARLTLLQAASLPDQGDSQRPEIAAQVTTEIPVRFGPETAIMQFQITREQDQESAGQPGAKPRRDWTLRFSMDAEPLGPVHAAIRLRDGHVGVRLWAERETIAARLQSSSRDLTQALEASAFSIDQVTIAAGKPADPRLEPHAVTRPHLLDRTT